MILKGELSFEEPDMLEALFCFSLFWREERSFNLKLRILLKTFKKWDNNFNNSCKLEVINMHDANCSIDFATVNDHDQTI